MRYGIKQTVAVLLAAVGIVAILPLAALGTTSVVSRPSSAGSGNSFPVRISWDGSDGTTIAVMASRVEAPPDIRTFTVHSDGLNYLGTPTYATSVTLPTGGDWLVFGREFGGLDDGFATWDSPAWTVAVDPLPLHVSSVLSHSWVSYNSAPWFTTTVTNTGGTPVANQTVDLLDYDGGAPHLFATRKTDVNGKAWVQLSHNTVYEPMPTRRWAWRVRGTATNGGVLGSAATTSIKVVLKKSATTRKTYTGTVYLHKGTKYQYWGLNGDATHKTVFVVKSHSGTTVLWCSAAQFNKKAFTVPTTATYYWTMRFTSGFYASWNIW